MTWPDVTLAVKCDVNACLCIDNRIIEPINLLLSQFQILSFLSFFSLVSLVLSHLKVSG